MCEIKKNNIYIYMYIDIVEVELMVE